MMIERVVTDSVIDEIAQQRAHPQKHSQQLS
jgi:hypothetical protein